MSPAGGGPPPGDAAAPAGAGLPAAWVGTLIFIAAEAMVFGGLLSALGAYRAWSPVWPPLGEPRLPLAVTAANTGVLMASAVAMRRALAAARRGRAHAARAALAATALLGAVFLAVQGSEWARMVAWGVTAVSSPYGGMFYVLLGFHGLHVLAAVAALLALAAAREPARTRARLQAAGLYWYFVCGVWAVIFPALYVR